MVNLMHQPLAAERAARLAGVRHREQVDRVRASLVLVPRLRRDRDRAREA
jgi:hypothetical protein